jgi:hypothetical protein
MSHYLREFPDYDSTLPSLEGFIDNSWRHDTCPAMINTTFDLLLFCGYEDPSLREHEGKKFALYNNTIDDGIMFITESDSIDEIKEAIAQWIKLS